MWQEVVDLIANGKLIEAARLVREAVNKDPKNCYLVDGTLAALSAVARRSGVEVSEGFDSELGYWYEAKAGRSLAVKAARVGESELDLLEDLADFLRHFVEGGENSGSDPAFAR